VGKIDGNLFYGINLSDVDVVMGGTTVVDIDEVALDYNFMTFLRGDVVLDDIRLTRPVFRVERTAEGWNIMRLVKARTPDSPRARRAIEIGEIGISDGTVYVEDAVGTSGVEIPERFEKIDITAYRIRPSAKSLTADCNARKTPAWPSGKTRVRAVRSGTSRAVEMRRTNWSCIRLSILIRSRSQIQR
jgi:hypothetical protein